MPRFRNFLPLSLAWLPIWALFLTLLLSVHHLDHWSALAIATRSVLIAALLGLGVYRLSQFWPWPRPLRLSFLLRHALAAAIYAGLWLALNNLVTLLIQLHLPPNARFVELALSQINVLVTGFWLYLISAGISYMHRAQQRAAALEVANAKAELAQLRTQLHPHFLFNALHSIVQLIPEQPAQATSAVETLADMLRQALDTQHDWISLGAELRFVERYLALERLRFGARLRYRLAIPESLLEIELPSFCLQILVENAVRHGAESKQESTTIVISASSSATRLTLQVHDDGAGVKFDSAVPGLGSGLARLRERLHWLYHGQAQLQLEPQTPGMLARLNLPIEPP
jgi:sensor histidine kinase YesM